MPTITDYGSLAQGIADFAHRSDLYAPASGINVVDYFIQGAQAEINKDVFDRNFGNGIAYMEAGYSATLAGGTTYLPTDYMSAKLFTVLDGGGNVFPLILKAPGWMYDRYPVRQPSGLPAYIARDVQANVAFTASLSAGTLTVSAISSGSLQIGNQLAGTGLPSGSTPVTITNQLTGTAGSTGTYSVNNTTLALTSQAMSSGGSVFVYGPYADANYVVRGSYYATASALTSTNTTNWMVTQTPNLLFFACMKRVMLYTRDMEGYGMWDKVYEDDLQALLDQDKAERWSAPTLQIDLG